MKKTLKQKILGDVPNVRLYYMFQFLMSLFFVHPVLVAFFVDWGGVTQAQAQILQSWFMLVLILAEIPTGIVADKYGRRLSVLLGIGMIIVGKLMYGSLPNFYWFALCESIFAVSIALMSGAEEALVYDSLKEVGKESEAKDVFGRALIFKMIAMVLNAPIGAFIAAKWGLNWTMVLSAVPSFLGLFVTSFFDEPLTKGESESRRVADVLKAGINVFRGSGAVKRLAFDILLASGLGYFVVWLYQPKLMALGVDVGLFGYFYALLIVAEMVIAANFSRLERLLGGKKRLVVLSVLGPTVGFLLAGRVNSMWVVILFLVIAGGLGLTRRSLMSVHVNKHVPSSERATVNSGISMLARFVPMTLNPLVGYLVDVRLEYAFYFLAVIGVAAVLHSVLRVREEMLS